MSLFRSAFTVGFYTLCSRIIGYVRDVMIASSLGAGLLSDAFFVAYRLPNFFRTLAAEGAFNAAFVPLFSSKLADKGQKEALSFASHILSFMGVALFIFTIIMEISMPAVMHVLAPGFVDDKEKFGLTVEFGHIVFPYLLCISLMSLFSGILNSLGKYAAAAFAPVWLNVTMIIALLIAGDKAPAHALSWGVAVAGVVQLVWMVAIAWRHGIVVRLTAPRLDNDVKTLLRRMLPGVVGSGVTQISLWINTVIATNIASAVSYLYYADRLVQLPLALIGTALGTVLLPTLSRQVREQKQEEAITTQNKALEIALLFTIPASIAFIVISTPIISLMFERGEFGTKETAATAAALVAYGFGLPAFVLVKIFAPAFFASGDTKTPVKIACSCLVFNVVTSLALIGPLEHVGLAIATTASSWLNSALLCFILIKRGLYHSSADLNRRLWLFIFSAIAMGLVVWLMGLVTTPWAGLNLPRQVVAVGSMISIGIAVYFAMLHYTGAAKLSYLLSLVKR